MMHFIFVGGSSRDRGSRFFNNYLWSSSDVSTDSSA